MIFGSNKGTIQDVKFKLDSFPRYKKVLCRKVQHFFRFGLGRIKIFAQRSILWAEYEWQFLVKFSK
jgi:hypothetical protein